MKTKIHWSLIFMASVAACAMLLTISCNKVVSGNVPAADPASAPDQDKGWRLWVKTQPCSARFDWLQVAKEAPPPQGGGLSSYVSYETVLGRAPVGLTDCLDSNPGSGCTFAQAEKLREAFRFHAKFGDYCCRDYSVWKDVYTNKMYVALVRTGTPGAGQQFVKGDLCCEEAETIAGTPGACSRQSGNSGGGMWGEINNQAGLSGKTLTFYGGTTPEQCQADCAKNPSCRGFTFMRAGAHQANDPKMCYLMSEATGYTPSPCCISGIKSENASRRTKRNTGGISNDETENREGSRETESRPKPTQAPTGGGRWILVSSTAVPAAREGYSGYSGQSTSTVLSVFNGDKHSFQWTNPPQVIDAGGFTISLNVQCQSQPNNRCASLIGVGGQGIESDATGWSIQAYGENGAVGSGQKTLTFKPTANSGELEVRIELMWGGVRFIHKYRRE